MGERGKGCIHEIAAAYDTCIEDLEAALDHPVRCGGAYCGDPDCDAIANLRAALGSAPPSEPTEKLLAVTRTIVAEMQHRIEKDGECPRCGAEICRGAAHEPHCTHGNMEAALNEMQVLGSAPRSALSVQYLAGLIESAAWVDGPHGYNISPEQAEAWAAHILPYVQSAVLGSAPRGTPGTKHEHASRT